MSQARIRRVSLDPLLQEAATPEQAQDRDIAIRDLVSANSFAPARLPACGYDLALTYEQGRIIFNLQVADATAHSLTDTTEDTQSQRELQIGLSLTPFKRKFRDYFDIYDAYQSAILTKGAAQVEAIDMARRGLHNDMADTLIERLENKVDLDHLTARRLISLIAALFYKKGLI